MKFAVLGSGLVGLYIGGNLLKAGHEVHFFGRQRYGSLIAQHGLTVSNIANEKFHVRGEEVQYYTDSAGLDERDYDYILVTLKAVQTAEAIAILQQSKRHHIVVSFQNGVKNAQELRQSLPSLKILPGMFPFNVVLLEECHIHQATTGFLYVGDSEEGSQLALTLTSAGLTTYTSPDMQAVQYGKLCFNLHNAISCLSGVPLKVELSTYGYRSIFARCIQEALDVLSAANIPVISPSAIPLWLLTWIMALPDWIFGATQLGVDETAYSSMYDDIIHGRLTEIDQLQGEIVRLGQEHNIPTPYNAALLRLVHEAEKANAGSPKLSVADLQALIDKSNI